MGLLNVEGFSLTGSLLVPAPRDQVFSFVSDLQNMERWWPEHTRYRRIAGSGRGSLWGWIYKAPIVPIPIAGVTAVVDHSPDERFSYVVPLLGVHIGYRFATDGDATRVTFSLSSPLAKLAAFAKGAAPEAERALSRLMLEMA